MNLDNLARTLVELIGRKIASGQLEVPALPWSRAPLMDSLKGRFDMAAVVPMVERDPLLLLECLRLVPRGGPRALDSVASVLEVVGAANLRQNMAMVVRRRSPDPRDADLRQAHERLCARAISTAAVARHVAVHATVENPDGVLLGSLVQGAAELLVALHLLDLERAAARTRGASGLSAVAFVELVKRCAPPVCKQLCERYSVPPFLTEVLVDDKEYDTANRRSEANCLRLAMLIVARAGIVVGASDDDAVQAGLLIGRSVMDVRDDALGHMVGAAQEAGRDCVL